MFTSDYKGDSGGGNFLSFAARSPFSFLFFTCVWPCSSEEKGERLTHLFVPWHLVCDLSDTESTDNIEQMDK